MGLRQYRQTPPTPTGSDTPLHPLAMLAAPLYRHENFNNWVRIEMRPADRRSISKPDRRRRSGGITLVMDEGEPVVTFSPSAELPALSERELEVLREVGRDWSAGLPDRRRRTEELPLDPALRRYRTPTPGRFSRIAELDHFRVEAPDRLVAGVDAITSAVPRLAPLTVPLGLVVIALLLAGNLRGVRAAGNIFAAPTYAFVAGIGLLLAVGLAHAARGGFATVPPQPHRATQALGLLLVLRAFSSGATSMTGIEAVSNAVPVFKPVEWRNARTTLTLMIATLVTMFAGLVVLMHLDGIEPKPPQTMLSQLAHRTFPHGPVYGYVQATTALVLLLAANTAYQDFPRLLFFMARDGYAPRAFLRMGDRLVFSNGILALTVAATVILLAFHGRTQALIPLYAVGVFLAFTVSQTGMVRHWSRVRGAHWRRSIAINATGAVLSALVLLTAAVTKFVEGAWVVVIAAPLLILVSLRIKHHHDTVHRALAPDTLIAAEDNPENAERPRQVRHLAVVPVARLDQTSLRALAYAASLGQPVFAVHVSPDDEEDERFRRQWENWGDHLRLEIIVSPHRAVIPSLRGRREALVAPAATPP